MKTRLKRAIHFKDGTEWLENATVIVTVNKESPMKATLENTETGDQKHIPSRHLHHFFNEFEAIEEDEIREAMFDSVCPSLTGCTVEPDGWDPDGFPSKLLALGLI